MDHRESLIALSRASNLGMDILRKIVDFTDGPQGFFITDRSRLEKYFDILKFSDFVRDSLLLVHDDPRVDETLGLMEKEGLKFITDEDEDYPERLKVIFAPPLYLYVKGDLKRYENSLGVIGSRNCTMYGKEVALSFSKIFASHGISIISGMAKGVDGYAHEGAMAGGGYTVAVLGFGSMECYPAEHRTLKERIAGTGCLVSEYHPLTGGNPKFFPARNRIIAALSDALLVVEAASKSGTLITVDFALSIGKTIYAVPGRIGDPLSEGCLELIKHGCRPLTDPADVLQDFGYIIKSRKKKKELELDEMQRRVFERVEPHLRSAEDIINSAGVNASEGLKLLFELEMKGLIRQPVTGGYIRTFVT